MRFSAPQLLSLDHQIEEFDCGDASLNQWLVQRAQLNQTSGGSRTYVVADADQSVVGYYALAAGAVAHREATGSVRRNMPDPIPVMVLARLAVDVRAQGLKVGAGLLQDAVARCESVAHQVGVRAVLVHALNDSARRFYEQYGFQASPLHEMTLMRRLGTGSIAKA